MIQTVVLTGFLGSGKTTLLGRLLRHPAFAKTAVIINEFGEIGLDHELIETSADSFIELRTGCLCCKIRNDLAATLHDLLRRRDQGSVTAFNRVVIETSGLADPAPILQTLMTDARLACRLALGGVVTTVDAVTGAATLVREDISVKQVAVADRLVLTKTDLLGPPAERAGAPPDLIGRLRSLNATAPLLHACHGEIDPECIFDGGPGDPLTKSPSVNSSSVESPLVTFVRANALSGVSLDVESWLGSAGVQAGHTHAPRHDHLHHGIDTYAILRNEPIRAVALTLFLEALTEHCGADLLRLKGIVAILESPGRPAVIHGVQHVFHPPSWLPRWPSDDRRSRIVFITRGIRRSWVETLLDALDAEVAEVAAGSTRQ